MDKFHTIAISAVITLALGTGVVAENLSKDEYKAAKDRIEATYRADKRRCDSMSGNAQDICNAEAEGREKIDLADLDARNNPTPEMRYEALIVKAEADYKVASEKCDDKAGNAKEVCLKNAAAAETSAKADAKAQLKISDAEAADYEKSAAERREAYVQAAKEKDSAGYEVQKQKCADYQGETEEQCVSDAKAQYGK
ncbi:MAG TPA: hypothetical protein VGL10_06715 [Gammaproteobacteria bacterium]